MDERVKLLEEHVQKLRNIAWVVGVLAVIFGLSGGWGLNSLSKSKESIAELEITINELGENTANTKETFELLRTNEESKLEQYASQQKTILTEHIQGAIVAFEKSECPSGWVPYEPAYGRFIRGLDMSGENRDPDGVRPFRTLQGDTFKAHTHALPNGEIVYSGSNSGPHSPFASSKKKRETGPPNKYSGSETRPKNVALLFCQKK